MTAAQTRGLDPTLAIEKVLTLFREAAGHAVVDPPILQPAATSFWT